MVVTGGMLMTYDSVDTVRYADFRNDIIDYIDDGTILYIRSEQFVVEDWHIADVMPFVLGTMSNAYSNKGANFIWRLTDVSRTTIYAELRMRFAKTDGLDFSVQVNGDTRTYNTNYLTTARNGDKSIAVAYIIGPAPTLTYGIGILSVQNDDAEEWLTRFYDEPGLFFNTTHSWSYEESRSASSGNFPTMGDTVIWEHYIERGTTSDTYKWTPNTLDIGTSMLLIGV
jgi:hypothetical protein